MSSSELAVRDPGEEAAYGLVQAEELFTPERREAIARFLSIDAQDPAMVPYLAICARWGLDPIAGHVWLIPQKVKVRDAETGRTSEVEKLRPAAGRDGYLAIARREAEYLGVAGDVVHHRDRFQVRLRRPDDPAGLPDAGGGRVVVHEYPDMQEVLAAEKDNGDFKAANYRGAILGAWAVCYLKGRQPVYYFASIAEHGKTWESGDGARKGWKGAWAYTSTMILKAAQSYVLRIATGITGIVPVDEVAEGNPEAGAEALAWDPKSCLPGFVDGDTAAQFETTVRRSWEVDPHLWNRSKLEMYAPNLQHQGAVEALILRVRKETAEERARQHREEEVVDGELVQEGDSDVSLSEGSLAAGGDPEFERGELVAELADVTAALEEGNRPDAEALALRQAEIRDLLSS